MQNQRCIGKMMKLLRSLQILLMAGTLTTGASASDDLFPLAQHSVAETHTAEADASNDDSGSQAPSDLAAETAFIIRVTQSGQSPFCESYF